MHTEFTTTPESHGEANGHWDLAAIGPDAAHAPYAEILFQNGPIKLHGVNGVQLTDVLKVCLARYKMLNESFRCRENSVVITKLQEAIMWDEERTAQRTAAGVEGSDLPRLTYPTTKES